jgi:AmmeMemoRadiSam system protein B
VAEADFVWQDRRLNVDREAAGMWRRQLGLQRDDYPFTVEHSIGALVPFAAQHFPSARVLAVIIHPACPFDMLDRLAGLLKARIERDDAVVLLSMDFAHRLDSRETARRDRESLAVLKALDGRFTRRLTSDCPKGWYVFARALQDCGPRLDVLCHTTNEEYLGTAQEDVTSYFFAIVSSDAAAGRPVR